MARGVCVFAGVPVRRAIAAERDAASLTGPQMNPASADFHALGALANFRLFNRFDRVEMRATSVRHDDLR